MSESNSDDENNSQDPHTEDLVEEVVADTAVLASAIGGVRGAIDSGLPSIVFLAIYFIYDHNLRQAIYGALAVGLLLAVISLLQRKSLQQVISGLFGLAISAYITARTGSAQNFFLPGIIRNGVYGLAFLVSIWLRRPILGYFLALLRSSESMKESAKYPDKSGLEGASKSTTRWQDDPVLLRKYSAVTWIWTIMFLGRVVIMYPLWLAGATGALGIVSVALGYPLFSLVIYFSYRILKVADAPTGAQSS